MNYSVIPTVTISLAEYQDLQALNSNGMKFLTPDGGHITIRRDGIVTINGSPVYKPGKKHKKIHIEMGTDELQRIIIDHYDAKDEAPPNE